MVPGGISSCDLQCPFGYHEAMQNPLEAYRRTQRELRRHFDAFTRKHCATCPTPCCRRPARILPTDILLAESIGWRAQLDEPDTERPATGEAGAVDLVG